MIVVDTSALMAIVMGEADGPACAAVLASGERPVVSAGTFSEALIVAGARGADERLLRVMDGLDFEFVPVTADVSRMMKDAYLKWGRGFHPAGLNFGDCFAYVLAQARHCPLLFVGDDFSKTDVVSAL